MPFIISGAFDSYATILSICLATIFLFMSGAQKTIASRILAASTRAIFGAENVTTTSNFYELVDKDMNGQEVSMSTFRTHVLVLVNVASQ